MNWRNALRLLRPTLCAGYVPGALRCEAVSGSTSLILSPPQTAARVEIFMIAVLPQAGQRHRNANGDAAAGPQSQGVSGCVIGQHSPRELVSLGPPPQR